VFGVVLCVATLSGFNALLGPTFYNSTASKISVRVKMRNGGFRKSLAAGEVFIYPFNAQIQSFEIQFSDGATQILSDQDTARLRSQIEVPKNQVWIIDVSNICVVDSRKLKSLTNAHCGL
jgi:hypothetical protein